MREPYGRAGGSSAGSTFRVFLSVAEPQRRGGAEKSAEGSRECAAGSSFHPGGIRTPVGTSECPLRSGLHSVSALRVLCALRASAVHSRGNEIEGRENGGTKPGTEFGVGPPARTIHEPGLGTVALQALEEHRGGFAHAAPRRGEAATPLGGAAGFHFPRSESPFPPGASVTYDLQNEQHR